MHRDKTIILDHYIKLIKIIYKLHVYNNVTTYELISSIGPRFQNTNIDWFFKNYY